MSRIIIHPTAITLAELPMNVQLVTVGEPPKLYIPPPYNWLKSRIG